MRPRFIILFTKEIKESLRDKRALSLLLIFALMYPLFYWLLLGKLIDGAHRLEKKGADVIIAGSIRQSDLAKQLTKRNFRLRESAPLGEQEILKALANDGIAAVIRMEDGAAGTMGDGQLAVIEMWYDSSADNDSNIKAIEDVFRDYTNGIVEARLVARSLPSTFTKPVAIKKNDVASNASRSARYLGAMLGFLFLPVFILCMSTALDSTAGERERRSLEILLAQPIKPYEIILGKWLAAASYSVIGVTLELVLVHMIFTWMPLEEIDLSWQLTTMDILAVCIATIPLALFAAALEILLAMNSKSLKEAQSLVSLVALVPILPLLIAVLFDFKGSLYLYLVPVLGNLTLLRELAKGEGLGLVPYLLTALTPLLISMFAIYIASQRMKSEKYVMNI